jgi:hypothetical protein
MPIKSCTRCGLKVLVDAQAAATDNFLCTRCAPDAKPAPASRPAGGGKRPTVKVTCPYCGASFSGSIPSRPAKGGCPVCQKELVLLPDGTIQAAASFNLTSWQKEKKTASNPPSAPAPGPVEAAPEMPSTPDPLGGSTILDMGGPPAGTPPAPLPTIDDQTIAIPGGVGDQTSLGMGSGGMESPPQTIEESSPEPLPEPPPEEAPEAPPDLGGATILDMGPGPVEIPSTIEDMSPKPDLLSDTMPGMDRPPSAESPVEPPLPPPIPEESVPVMEPPPEVTEEPTIRDEEVAPPEEPAAEPVLEEPTPASIESAPEIPADLGGQTILDMGGTGDMGSRLPEPAPSIEEPPPEAVPILAQDVESPDSPPPDAPAEPEAAAAAEPVVEKPYVYQPIARTPRKPPPSTDPLSSSPGSKSRPPAAAPPPPPPASAPVLGSDFRIAAPPPEPKPSPERAREEKKPAGPRAGVVLPRAEHSFGKLVFAWILVILPLAAGFLLYSMQKNSTVEKVIQKFTNEMRPGIDKIKSEIEKGIKKQPEPPAEK